MYIAAQKLSLLQKLIKDLYHKKFDESLILDTANTACQIIDGHYFALYLFNEQKNNKPIFISNNPSDFIPVYLSVINKDFLINALIGNGHEYVLRRNPEINEMENNEFVSAVQTARPISDIVYNPLLTNNEMRGYWALGRAGLHNSWYTDSELEIFRFIVSFLNDAFQRTYIPEPATEDVAYLDREGNVLSAGSHIAEVCSEIFGWGKFRATSCCLRNREIFISRYQDFFFGPYKIGMDKLTLEHNGRRYFFMFSPIGTYGIKEYSHNPCVIMRLLDERCVLPMDTLLDFMALSRRYGITRREFEVIHSIFQAKSNKVIAMELHVDESTIKRHTHNIYEKTGCRSRVELVQGLKFN